MSKNYEVKYSSRATQICYHGSYHKQYSLSVICYKI